MMNDEWTYQEAVRELAGLDERVKTLMLAHLLTFGRVDPCFLQQLAEEYEHVSAGFFNQYIEEQ